MGEGVACRCTVRMRTVYANMAREWRELPGYFTSPRSASILRYVPLSSARATFREAIKSVIALGGAKHRHKI